MNYSVEEIRDITWDLLKARTKESNLRGLYRF